MAFCFSSNSFCFLLNSAMNFSCAFLPSAFSVIAFCKSITATLPAFSPAGPACAGAFADAVVGGVAGGVGSCVAGGVAGAAGAWASNAAGNNRINMTKLSFLISSSSLESSSNRKFELMGRLVDRERGARERPEKCVVDTVRILGINDPEWRLDDRQQNLKLDARAAPDTGIRTGQELHRHRRKRAVTVRYLPRQLPLLDHPRVPCIEKRR